MVACCDELYSDLVSTQASISSLAEPCGTGCCIYTSLYSLAASLLMHVAQPNVDFPSQSSSTMSTSFFSFGNQSILCTLCLALPAFLQYVTMN